MSETNLAAIGEPDPPTATTPQDILLSGEPGPSEPISKESTDDLIHPAGSHGQEGVLAKVEHKIEEALTKAQEGLIEAFDPGAEMVGEVTQETETGEKVVLPDTEGPVARAAHAVSAAVQSEKEGTPALSEEGAKGVGNKRTSGGEDSIGEKSGQGGYTSDSDVPGPVIEGVHPALKPEARLEA